MHKPIQNIKEITHFFVKTLFFVRISGTMVRVRKILLREEIMQNLKQKHHKHIFINTISPVLLYGGVTGALVGACITLFKFCAAKVITLSEEMYHYVGACVRQGNFLPFLLAAAILTVLALGMSLLYKKMPNVRGGGIPTSIGITRGVIPFHWLTNLAGSFLASLVSFLTGVPLGTEGPSVQIGTAMGGGISKLSVKKHAAWKRYIMTGGACAGFSAATGAPISGILFAIEEAHQRISPMVFAVAATAVTTAQLLSGALSPLFHVETELFAPVSLPKLAATDLWITPLLGILIGFCAVAFLKYYRILSRFWQKKLCRVPSFVKILTVFLATLILGCIAQPFVSTGHGLVETMLEGGGVWYILLAALFLRSTLMILCSASGITGGMFLPILALGALISALLGRMVIAFCGVPVTYYPILVMLGVAASIAGMMKMPITAMVFAIEVLSAAENILPVFIVTVLAYAVTEIFYVDSINENVLEHRISDLHKGEKAESFDAHLVLQEDCFAVGKQIRDILWPSGLVILSFKRAKKQDTVVDAYGEKLLHVGDELHVRYATYDHAETLREIAAIVGEQRKDDESALDSM